MLINAHQQSGLTKERAKNFFNPRQGIGEKPDKQRRETPLWKGVAL